MRLLKSVLVLTVCSLGLLAQQQGPHQGIQVADLDRFLSIRQRRLASGQSYSSFHGSMEPPLGGR